MIKRRAAALTAGVMLLSGVAANVALAHHDSTSTAATNFTRFRYNDVKDKFVGLVGSEQTACVGQRKVKLIKKSTGRRVGVALTTSLGRWSIKARDNSGKYYAKVTRATVVLDSGSAGYGTLWEHLLTCGTARTIAKST